MSEKPNEAEENREVVEEVEPERNLGNVTTTCIEHCAYHPLPYRLSFQIKVF